MAMALRGSHPIKLIQFVVFGKGMLKGESACLAFPADVIRVELESFVNHAVKHLLLVLKVII